MSSATDPRLAADEVRPGSDRSFGFVFAAVFALVGLWPLIGAHAPRWWALALGVAFGCVAVAAPWLLRPLNYVWFRFGLLLHRIVSPLVMGGVFFLCVTPMGLVMRLLGKDLLSLRRRADLSSYWIPREPTGPESETMKRQF